MIDRDRDGGTEVYGVSAECQERIDYYVCGHDWLHNI